jgi:hypothetical protein
LPVPGLALLLIVGEILLQTRRLPHYQKKTAYLNQTFIPTMPQCLLILPSLENIANAFPYYLINIAQSGIEEHQYDFDQRMSTDCVTSAF